MTLVTFPLVTFAVTTQPDESPRCCRLLGEEFIVESSTVEEPPLVSQTVNIVLPETHTKNDYNHVQGVDGAYSLGI